MSLLAISDAAADGGGVSEAQLAPHPCFHSRVCAQESDDEFDDMPPLVELSSSENEDEVLPTGCRRCQGLSTAGACMHVLACLSSTPCRCGPMQCRQCQRVLRVREVPLSLGANKCVRACAYHNTTLIRHSHNHTTPLFCVVVVATHGEQHQQHEHLIGAMVEVD